MKVLFICASIAEKFKLTPAHLYNWYSEFGHSRKDLVSRICFNDLTIQ